MSPPSMPRLLEPLFSTDRVREILGDRGRLQAMLDFEAALARAEARVDVIPSTAVTAIAAQCRAEFYDMSAMAQEATLAGNLAIPMVKVLTALVARTEQEAAEFVHWGATSQDAIDTGLVLQLRDVFTVIDEDLARLAARFAALAATHERTPLAGRTWLQHAAPMSFGLKAVGWLDVTGRHRERLRETRARLLTLQFGGAAGTLAALGAKGMVVASALAEDLSLALPDLPWHTHRDRVAEVATTLGLLVGTLGKVARDISLLMQTEVGEAFEPGGPGRGGSSSMPHKRNPVGSAVILAAALRVPPLVSTMLTAMGQEHERGLGGWQAEWETLPEICLLTSGALAHLIQVAEGLEVDEARMRANLDLTHGLIMSEAVTMALTGHLGRSAARRLVEEAIGRARESGRGLRDVLEDELQVAAYLSSTDLDRVFDPRSYLGCAEQFVDRALTTHAVGLATEAEGTV